MHSGKSAAPALLAAVAALALGCGKQPSEWRADLRSQDPFARLLAALALADDPRATREVLPVLFEGTHAGNPREVQAARAAIRDLAARDLAALVEFRLAGGRDDPTVRNLLKIALRTAQPDGIEHLIDGLRVPDHGELDDLREGVVGLAARDESALRRLSERVATAEAGLRERLAKLLFEVGPAALPEIERIRPRVDLEALGFDLSKIGAARGVGQKKVERQ